MEAAVTAMLDRIREGGMRDERVLHAMSTIPRAEFVPPNEYGEAYADRALAIGEGQTISQPLMVAIIVAALELRDDDIALDVGTGSGYQAAIMAACGARVISIERLPSLAESARERLRLLGLDVEVVTGDGSVGLPGRGPFDAIAVGAAAPRLPRALARQLAEGGRMVVPLSNGPDAEELTRLRIVNGQWRTDSLGPCRFVPLIGEDAYAPPG